MNGTLQASDSLNETNSWLEEALALHQQNDLEQAGILYAMILDREPRHFNASLMLGLLRHQERRFPAAIEVLQRAVSLNPRSAPAHLNLGISLWTVGRQAEALSHYQWSLRFDKDHSETLFNCAYALQALNRPDEAILIWDRLLALCPGAPSALLNRGLVLEALARPEEAMACFVQALDRDSKLEETLVAKAEKYNEESRHEEALALLDKICERCPDSGGALLARAATLFRLRRHTEALADLGRVIVLQPDCVDALVGRGHAQLKLLRPREALATLDLALILEPNHLEALYCKANALLVLQRPVDALVCCNQALVAQPDCPETLLNRGIVLVHHHRAMEALVDFERALALRPHWADLLMNLGLAQHLVGRPRDAMESYEKALRLDPGNAVNHSIKIHLLDHLPEMGLPEHQLERRKFQQVHARSLESLKPVFLNDRTPSRRLVIGYVSRCFMRGSTASTFLPIFQNHSKADFQINCYADVLVEDDWTQRCRDYADVWRQVVYLSDEALAAQIRDDGVDILVDLSGHTPGNRLLAFARKPAPIQVTAWGHGGGTGLATIDYLFADPMAIPAGDRPHFAEQIYDLPCHITFEPPSFSPDLVPLPAQTNGYVTFGSLNRYSKVTPGVERLWARILASVPGSRLLMKDTLFEDPQGRAMVLDSFARLGIERERIELRGSTSREGHLAAYGAVDILLDPFPLNGGITTWESLWMGVPVVSLLGNTIGSRASGAILHALHLDDWVAQNEEGYLGVAIQKAKDIQALARFRQDIRSRVNVSPAGNPELYTRAVEGAYRAMWKTWLQKVSQ